MKENIKKISLITGGLLFIGFGIFAMDFGIYYGKPGWIFWLCYIGMIIIGFGIITKNSYLILSQLNILAIPLLFWNIDFIYFLFTKTSLWGITDYFFDNLIPAVRLISFEHLFLVPLSLVSLYLIKIKKKGVWKFSLIQLAGFFLLSRLFTEPSHNVNCVFTSCFPIFPSDVWHPARWFIISGLFVIITNFIITKIFILRKN